ncbi:syndecan-3-like [Heterodontus francisci]|uniref:syndecan-3-like n=1 Tax=Heterodontus francisci TaxID=7792 RepID=UPI00355B03F9
MKTSNFSLKFLLAMGFPFVLLAITPTKVPKDLISDELEGSGTDSEDDDIYSGSGSGDGFILLNSGSNVEHTTAYHTLPSTVSSNLHSTSQVTTTKITSEVITDADVNTLPVHVNLPVVNTTIETIVTSSISSTTVSKDVDAVIVPQINADNLARGVGPKHDPSTVDAEMSSASPTVHTTSSGRAVSVINDESLAVPKVFVANEMTTMMVKKADPTEEGTAMVIIGMTQKDNTTDEDDLFFTDIIEKKTSRNQNHIPDSRSSIEPPEERYSQDVSSSGSFLEKRELLAATVAGGFVGLVLAVLLVVVLVYRMKKKDEGSYTLDESKQPNGGYQKPQKQEEFYA